MNMKVIPHDIWVYIARYIPEKELIRLYAVNSSFFHIALETKYKCVLFHNYDRRRLEHLGNKSEIQDFVRRVVIRPWHVQPLERCNSLISRLWIFFNVLGDPEYVRRRSEEQVKKRVQKHIRRVMDTVSKFKNVQEYQIDWDGQNVYHSEFFSAFLTPLLKELGKNLTRLSLKVPTEALHTLVPAHPLPRLKELELSLCTNSLPSKDINHALDVFLVFIHNLSPTLESLSVSSTHASEQLDLSLFFQYLGRFSRLRRLSLSIPFDGAHLPDPSQLKDFLDSHCNTLDHLTLSTSRCLAAINRDHSFKGDWIQKSLPDAHLSRLQSLEVALRPLRAPLDPIIEYLRAAGVNLETLVLADRSLTYTEAESIVGALDGGEMRLKRLRLQVRQMSPQLLDMLARSLPQLRRLELSFTEVVCRENDGYESPACPRAFIEQMQLRRYDDWELSHIRLPGCCWQMRPVFFQCIPTLRGFERWDL